MGRVVRPAKVSVTSPHAREPIVLEHEKRVEKELLDDFKRVTGKITVV